MRQQLKQMYSNTWYDTENKRQFPIEMFYINLFTYSGYFMLSQWLPWRFKRDIVCGQRRRRFEDASKDSV